MKAKELIKILEEYPDFDVSVNILEYSHSNPRPSTRFDVRVVQPYKKIYLQ